MSHSEAIAQRLKKPQMPSHERSMWLADQISTLIIEAPRYADESDPCWMPHYLEAKVDRWAYVTERVATFDRDPCKSVQRAYEGLAEISLRAQRAYSFNWDHKNEGYDSFLNEEARSRRYKDKPDPVAAVLRSIDLQKTFASYARDKAITTFRNLAAQYPEQAITVMDTYASFNCLCGMLKGSFDLEAFRQELSTLVPPAGDRIPKPVTPLAGNGYF